MIIPLKDNIQPRRFPLINYAMISVCALVSVPVLLAEPEMRVTVFEQYGMIPARVVQPGEPVMIEQVAGQDRLAQPDRRLAAEPPFHPWLTVLTCIFLHGGWLHFVGNMWFLYIFGDNVEDRLGRTTYLVFFVGCGVAASLAHLAANPTSPIPTIGASGSLAGVMGAYLLLYPRARVLAVIPIFIIFPIVVLPASLFLGVWFLLQFFLGMTALAAREAGGVAWWAHIGGFAVGFLAAALLKIVHQTEPPVDQIRPNTDRPGMYRDR